MNKRIAIRLCSLWIGLTALAALTLPGCGGGGGGGAGGNVRPMGACAQAGDPIR